MPRSWDLREAEEQLRTLILDAVADETGVSITENGAPLATVIAAAKLDAMLRTSEMLSDPDLVDDLVAGLCAPKIPGAQMMIEILRARGVDTAVVIPLVPEDGGEYERDHERADQLREAADLLQRLERAVGVERPTFAVPSSPSRPRPPWQSFGPGLTDYWDGVRRARDDRVRATSPSGSTNPPARSRVRAQTRGAIGLSPTRSGADPPS
jgi:hypothetical protein